MQWPASARFGRLVEPGAGYLDAFAAMVAESVAVGEPDHLVTSTRLRQQPGLVLRQLEAASSKGIARYWLISSGEVLATGSMEAHGTRWFGHIGFFVRPSRRNQGIGRALMTDLVALARRSGVRAPRAMVEPGNAASRRAIEAAGGTLVKIFSEGGLHRCVYEFAK